MEPVGASGQRRARGLPLGSGPGQGMTRRGFLTRSGLVVAGGLWLPVGAVGCGEEAGEIVAELIAAAIVTLATDATQYFVGDAVGGLISLSNETGTIRSGFANLGLVDSAENLVAGGKAPYEVPPFTINEYRWAGLESQQPGDLRAIAITALSRVLSDFFQMLFR